MNSRTINGRIIYAACRDIGEALLVMLVVLLGAMLLTNWENERSLSASLDSALKQTAKALEQLHQSHAGGATP